MSAQARHFKARVSHRDGGETQETVMDFRGNEPRELTVAEVSIAILGGVWIGAFVWWVSQHLTVGWH